MFRALSTHIQEDTVVYMQHMVLSVSTRARGGLSVHSLRENWLFIKYYIIFIKYCIPLHVSSLKCSSSGGYNCIHAAYGTVTVRDGLSVHSLSENWLFIKYYIILYYIILYYIILYYIILYYIILYYIIFIKYCIPLHVSSLKCSCSGGYNCIHAAYGTVTVRGGLSVHSSSW